MKLTISKKGILFFIILTILLSFILYYNPGILKSNVTPVTKKWTIMTSLDELTEGRVIKQNFIPHYSYIKSMKILFSAKNNSNVKGNIRFQIYNKDDTIVFDTTIAASELKSLEYYDIIINKKIKKDTVYYYTLTGIGTSEDTAPSVYTGMNSQTEQTNLYNNGIYVGNSIVMISDYEIYHFSHLLQIAGLMLLLLFVLIINLNIKNKIFKKTLDYIPISLYILILSLLSFGMVELAHENSIKNIKFSACCLNIAIYLILYWVMIALSKYYKVACVVATTIFFLFGVANHYVEQFRGSPILPWDIYSVRTAASVSGGYEYTLTLNIVLCFLLMLFINIVIIKFYQKEFHFKRHIRYIATAIVVTAGFLFAFFQTSMLTNLNIKANLWSQVSGYKYGGVSLSFMTNIQYMMVEKPANYSKEIAEEILDKVDKSANIKPIETEKPNIIVVMSEAFTDFSYIGDFKTSEDYMPFYRSLTENTIKGNLMVSTYAGGTATTEFEFLTGNTMGFLPTGSIAYEQYIHDEQDSLASHLKTKGYDTIALHPYYNTGWNRKKVYPLIGFDRFLDIDSFTHAEYIRNYISDKSSFYKIMQLYNNRNKNKKLFLFNITMQNHSGYKSEEVLDYNIKIQSSQEYPQAEQYLSVIRKSDDALKELIDFFKKQEEPTIILFFGDHFPQVETAFYEELYNCNSLDELSLEEKQKIYTTPFCLWANYDIEDEYIEKISANYLATILLKTAGIEGTAYQKFLYELYQKIPVTTALGFQDNKYNFYSYEKEDISKYKDEIDQYKILQYNNMFEKQK